MHAELKDKAWLELHYVEKVMSLQEIADQLGCSKSTVHAALKKSGIERRKRTSKYRLINDKEWLKRVYQEEEMSLSEIAKEAGCSVGNVHAAIVSLGLETRSGEEALAIKYPEGRKGKLAPNWRGGRRKMLQPKRQYEKRLGEKASHWKGGRVVTGGGYIYTYAPDHPRTTKQGYVMEHRLVMEKSLGRYLKKNEIVHHKNGDKQDNRIENLELVTRSEHVSNHFANGYELDHWQQRVKELEAENEKLRQLVKKAIKH